MSAPRWACPVCCQPLDAGLACLECGFRGAVRDGLYYLHRSDDSWDRCLIERNGWVSATKERGLLRPNEDHFYLPDGRPHLKEFYRESKAHLDLLLRSESLQGRVCLDLGASIGWAEAYLLRHQPEAVLVALEVNDDPLCGLGRSAALKERLGLGFYSVVADMHFIPLETESVDLVFTLDALHHFREPERVFQEIRRVLGPGGVFYGLNEPDRPEGVQEDEYVRAHIEVELRHQIIERRPTLREYEAMGACLGLYAANRELGLRKNVDTAGLVLKGSKR